MKKIRPKKVYTRGLVSPRNFFNLITYFASFYVCLLALISFGSGIKSKEQDLEISVVEPALIKNGSFEEGTKSVATVLGKGVKCPTLSKSVKAVDESKTASNSCNIGTIGNGWEITGSLTGKETILVSTDKVKSGKYSQKIFTDRSPITISQTINSAKTGEYQLSVFVYVEKGTVLVSAGGKETKLQPKVTWQEVKLAFPSNKQTTLQVKGGEYAKFWVDGATIVQSKTADYNDATNRVTKDILLNDIRSANKHSNTAFPSYIPGPGNLLYKKIKPIYFLAPQLWGYDNYFVGVAQESLTRVVNFFGKEIPNFKLVVEPVSVYKSNSSFVGCGNFLTEQCQVYLLDDAEIYSGELLLREDKDTLIIIFVPGGLLSAYTVPGITPGKIVISGDFVPGTEGNPVPSVIRGSSGTLNVQSGVISHEIGHNFGLSHSFPNSFMSYASDISKIAIFDTDYYPEKYIACSSSLNRGVSNCNSYSKSLGKKYEPVNSTISFGCFGASLFPKSEIKQLEVEIYEADYATATWNKYKDLDLTFDSVVTGSLNKKASFSSDFDISGSRYFFTIKVDPSGGNNFIVRKTIDGYEYCYEYGIGCEGSNSGKFVLNIFPYEMCLPFSLSLTVDNSSLVLGQSTTIRWSSTNAVSCRSYGQFWENKERGTSGSTNTGVFSSVGKHAYDMVCTAKDGVTSVGKSVVIEVKANPTPPPTPSTTIRGRVGCQYSGLPSDIGEIYAIDNSGREIASARINSSGEYSFSYAFKTQAQDPNVSYAIRPRKTTEAQNVCISSNTVENGIFKDTDNNGSIDTLCSTYRGTGTPKCERIDDSDGIAFGFLNCNSRCVSNPDPTGQYCDTQNGQNFFNMGGAPTAVKEGNNVRVCYPIGDVSNGDGFFIYKNRDIQFEDRNGWVAINPDYTTGRNNNCKSIPLSALSSGTNTFKAFPDIGSGKPRQRQSCQMQATYNNSSTPPPSPVVRNGGEVSNVLAKISPSNSSSLTLGKSLSIDLSWVFSGEGPDSFTVSRSVVKGTSGVDSTIPSIGSTKRSYTNTWTPTETGTYTISYWVCPTYLGLPEPKNKKCANSSPPIRNVVVLDAPKYDFSISTLYLPSSVTIPRSTGVANYTVTVSSSNTGSSWFSSGSGGGYFIKLYKGTNTESNVVYSYPCTQQVCSFNYKATITSRDTPPFYTACADPGNMITETNETNNCKTSAVLVVKK